MYLAKVTLTVCWMGESQFTCHIWGSREGQRTPGCIPQHVRYKDLVQKHCHQSGPIFSDERLMMKESNGTDSFGTIFVKDEMI